MQTRLNHSEGIEQFNVLIDLGRYAQDHDSLHQSIRYFRKAIQIGQSDPQKYPIQIPYRYAGLSFINLWEKDSILIYLKEGLKYAKQMGDERIQLLCYIDFGQYYSMSLVLDSAKYCLEKAMYLAVKRNDELATISVLNSLANISDRQGNLSESVNLYLKVLDRCEEADLQIEKGIVLNNLGHIYRLVNSRIAMEYYKEALEIADHLNAVNLQSLVQLNISFLYLNEKRYTESLKSFLKTLELSKLERNEIRMILAYNGLTRASIENNDCLSAKVYLDSAFQMLELKKYEFGTLMAEINQTLMSSCKGSSRQSVDTLIKKLEVIKKSGIPQLEYDLNTIIHQELKEMGKEKEALTYLERSIFLKDSIHSDSLLMELIQVKHLSELEKLENKLNMSIDQISRSNNFYTHFLYVLSGLIVLLVLISVFLFRKNKFLKNEAQRHQSENEKVKDQVQIMSSVLYGDKIDNAESLMPKSLLFEEKIVRLYPELSLQEIKVCNLIRQNFTTKEIASHMNRSVGTIDNYRSNIRRKMRLVGDDNLLSTLHSI